MESIKINELTKKDSGLVIVKYNGDKEATLNTKWQAQEVDYLEKDVGVGGQCIVEIKQKGEYTNITKVDMKSAVKGETTLEVNVPHKCTSRDNSIVCQCLLKIAGDNIPISEVDTYGQILCTKLRELVGAYKLGLSLLDE